MDRISVRRRRRYTALLNLALDNIDLDKQISDKTVEGLARVHGLKRRVSASGDVPLHLRKSIEVVARNAAEDHQKARALSFEGKATLKRVMVYRRSFPSGFYRRVLSGFSANWRLERRKIRRFLMNKLGK